MSGQRPFCATCQQYLIPGPDARGWVDWAAHRDHVIEMANPPETVNFVRDVQAYLERHRAAEPIPPERLHRLLSVLTQELISTGCRG